MNKIILILILLLIIPGIVDPSISIKDRSGKILAGIEISEYEKILPAYGPLDRLFCSGDICYFIIPEYKVDSIIKDGFRIRSLHDLPEKRSGISTTYYDINGSYHNYNETYELLSDLALRYPEYARLISIGKSIEGRNIYVLKISDNVNEEESEPNIFFLGCHHAREWISVEIPLLFAQYLLTNIENDAEVRKAVNGTQIYILPILNPDGLEFSITHYRYWRKNRRYNGDLTWGVDLNRNYSYKWGLSNEGSSPSPLSEVYRGTGPFSEPETKALEEFMTKEVPSGVLSYHNFSQLILYPWGYTLEPPEDFDELDKIGRKMSEMIFEVNGRKYVPGSGSYNIYETNGDMVDWVYGTFRVPAFTIELPPGYYFEGGFFTSNEEISITFSENLPAMMYFTNYFIDNKFPEKEN